MTWSIEAPFTVFWSTMNCIISSVQGNRVLCAADGKCAMLCLTVRSSSLSNTLQHLTNLEIMPWRSADMIDGMDRTLQWSFWAQYVGVDLAEYHSLLWHNLHPPTLAESTCFPICSKSSGKIFRRQCNWVPQRMLNTIVYESNKQ
jgi:hypothetical protein